MIGSLHSSSAVSPQMESKRRFSFGKLSTEWWARPSQANTDKYGEKKLMKDTNPASGANAEGNNDILRGSTNNIELECRVR